MSGLRNRRREETAGEQIRRNMSIIDSINEQNYGGPTEATIVGKFDLNAWMLLHSHINVYQKYTTLLLSYTTADVDASVWWNVLSLCILFTMELLKDGFNEYNKALQYNVAKTNAGVEHNDAKVGLGTARSLLFSIADFIQKALIILLVAETTYSRYNFAKTVALGIATAFAFLWLFIAVLEFQDDVIGVIHDKTPASNNHSRSKRLIRLMGCKECTNFAQKMTIVVFFGIVQANPASGCSTLAFWVLFILNVMLCGAFLGAGLCFCWSFSLFLKVCENRSRTAEANEPDQMVALEAHRSEEQKLDADLDIGRNKFVGIAEDAIGRNGQQNSAEHVKDHQHEDKKSQPASSFPVIINNRVP